MNVEAVHIVDDYQSGGHSVYVIGRPYPDARRAILDSDGWTWRDMEGTEQQHVRPTVRLPHGLLDLLVAEHRGTTPAQPATERHLADAIAMRDRLLALLEDR